MSQYSFEAMVMYGFKEIDAFFSEFFEAFMNEYKLNAIQIKAIMEVKISKAISMKDLCDRLGMSKSNLSPVCKKLEGLKLLKKTRDFHDQRIVNLEITPAGEEVLSALCSQIKEYTRPYFEKLTEEEKESVIEGFRILLESMNR